MMSFWRHFLLKTSEKLHKEFLHRSIIVQKLALCAQREANLQLCVCVCVCVCVGGGGEGLWLLSESFTLNEIEELENILEEFEFKMYLRGNLVYELLLNSSSVKTS